MYDEKNSILPTFIVFLQFMFIETNLFDLIWTTYNLLSIDIVAVAGHYFTIWKRIIERKKSFHNLQIEWTHK